MRTFKNVCRLLILFALTASVAHAETMTIGNYTIHYVVPDGYVELNRRANDEKITQYLDRFDAIHKDVQCSLFSFFVKKEQYEIMNYIDPIDYFASIFYNDILADEFLSDTDFAEFKKLTAKEFSQEEQHVDFQETSFLMSNQTMLKEDATSFSFSQISRLNENSPAVFSVTNIINIEGKVLFISYNKKIENQSDMAEIIAGNDNFVKALRLEAAPGQTRPAAASGGAATASGGARDGLGQAMPLLLMIVGGTTVAMVLVVGLVGFFVKRKEKK